MTKPQPPARTSLTTGIDEPLLGVIEQQNGAEVVRYFTDAAEAEAGARSVDVKEALSLLGAWSHLDAEQMLDELDRIRHSSRPTPALELPELEA